MDIDFAFYKPMDALFDAIRFDKDSAEGQAARSKLLLERPGEPLPDKIDSFITRDWPQVAPNKFPPGYQVSSSLDFLPHNQIFLNFFEGWFHGSPARPICFVGADRHNS